ncbi:MAG: biotin/lipoyl-binding protein [Phycisphaerales bacterium]
MTHLSDGPSETARDERTWSTLLESMRRLAPADRATLIQFVADDPVAIAWSPPDAADRALPYGLVRAVAETGEARSEVEASGDEQRRWFVTPVLKDASILVALDLGPVGAAAIEDVCRRLAHAAPLVRLIREREANRRIRAELDADRLGIELVSRIERHRHFDAAAIAFCDELAHRLNADRVTLAVVEGWDVRAVAISDVERFSRRMELVRDIEAAMSESFDQGAVVVHPAPRRIDPHIGAVTRDAARLAARHGDASVLAAPVARDGEAPRLMACVERRSAWSDRDVEAIVTALRMAAPPMVTRMRTRSILDRRREILTRRRIILAIAALLLIAAAIPVPDIALAQGTIGTKSTSIVTTPWDGRLAELAIRRGDAVNAGQIIARMETTEVAHELEAATARAEALQRRVQRLRAEGDVTALTLASLDLERARSEVAFHRERTDRADLVSPTTGVALDTIDPARVGAAAARGQSIATIGVGPGEVAHVRLDDRTLARIDLGDQAACVTSDGRRVSGVVTEIRPRFSEIAPESVYEVVIRLDEKTDLAAGEQITARIRTGRTTLLPRILRPLSIHVREWAFRTF